MRKIYVLLATILMTILVFSSVSFVFATSADRELTNDEKAAFIVRDEWTAWVKSFTASLSELDKNATAKIYDDMDFYDMQYRFTEKYKKVPEYLDEDGKPTQKLKDMIKKKRKELAGAKALDFLCFTAKADGVTIRLNNASLAGSGKIGKSSDGVSFIPWDGTQETLNNGDKLYVWNKGNSLSTSTGNYAQFVIAGGNVEASGDVASMINFGDATSHCFYRLFKDQTNLISLPEVSVANTADSCYREMFSGCTNAKTGPSSLPAANIANSAYDRMFQSCSQLETAPSIQAKSVGNSGCVGMFVNCTALTVAPELPATTINEDGYNGMFEGCTELVTVPSTLPALTIPSGAYRDMFHNCNKITKTPYIKAKTLADGSIYEMFGSCYLLNEIHLEDYNGVLTTTQGQYAFEPVAASGTIYYPGPTEPDDTDSIIPSGWTKVSPN